MRWVWVVVGVREASGGGCVDGWSDAGRRQLWWCAAWVAAVGVVDGIACLFSTSKKKKKPHTVSSTSKFYVISVSNKKGCVCYSHVVLVKILWVGRPLLVACFVQLASGYFQISISLYLCLASVSDLFNLEIGVGVRRVLHIALVCIFYIFPCLSSWPFTAVHPQINLPKPNSRSIRAC